MKDTHAAVGETPATIDAGFDPGVDRARAFR
jgi:hypothetical protein